jgi:hypothetical protein
MHNTIDEARKNSLQMHLLDLDGIPVDPLHVTKRPNQLLSMHGAYGAGPKDKKCGDCFFITRDTHHNKAYFKCQIFGVTRGQGSDFRKKWPSCGSFKQKEEQEV